MNILKLLLAFTLLASSVCAEALQPPPTDFQAPEEIADVDNPETMLLWITTETPVSPTTPVAEAAPINPIDGWYDDFRLGLTQ